MRICMKCGCAVERGTKFCTHCGAELPMSEKSVAIVYGLKQKFLLGGTMKLFIDGVFYAKVKKFESVEIPVTKNCVLTASCGINPFSGRIPLYVGEEVKIQITYDRLIGTFDMKEINE